MKQDGVLETSATQTPMGEQSAEPPGEGTAAGGAGPPKGSKVGGPSQCGKTPSAQSPCTEHVMGTPVLVWMLVNWCLKAALLPPFPFGLLTKPV